MGKNNEPKNRNIVSRILSLTVLLSLYNPVVLFSQSISPEIAASNKKVKRAYYLHIMDSLVNAQPNDTFYKCHICIEFIYQETKIPASGSINFLGQFDFTKEDLKKWHEWYKRKHIKIKN